MTASSNSTPHDESCNLNAAAVRFDHCRMVLFDLMGSSSCIRYWLFHPQPFLE